MEIATSVDNVKKGRMLGLAALISLSMIGLQITSITRTPSSTEILIRAGLYFVVTFLGLIWALRFQVTLRSLMYIIPQSAFFVFSEYIFLEFFFFNRVGRVYEFFIMFLALIGLFVATYSSFLMANVFNVAVIKDIPLVNVGKTVSYVLSLLSVYFLTYGLLYSNTNILVLIALLVIGYILTITFHFRNVEMAKERVGRVVFLSTITMLITVLGASAISYRYELISLLSTVVLFAVTSVVSKKENEDTRLKLASYLIIIFILFTYLIIKGIPT